MNIEMVNHAGFLLTSGRTGLIVDPWLQGSAFSGGWELLSPTVFSDDDWDRVTHMWISHEHPDHFSIPSLRAIPSAARNRIEVLYQTTADKRVVKFCETLFDTVTELPPTAVQIGDLRICSTPHTFGDSYLWVDDGSSLVLDLNDCVFDSDRELTRALAHLPRRPDVLFTQFSYANWCGNPDEPEARRAYARKVWDSVLLQVRTLEPDYVVPFASFIWQAHEENSYMNDTHNDIGETATLIAAETSATPVVLYNGDRWDCTAGRGADLNDIAVGKYRADLENWESRGAIHSSEKVPLDELVALAEKWHRDLVGLLGRQRRILEIAGYLRAVSIYVTDHELAFVISGSSMEVDRNVERDECHMALTSDTLASCFTTSYGGMTLGVNGRFSVHRPDGHRLVTRYFHLAWLESQAKSPASELWALSRRRLAAATQRLSVPVRAGSHR